MADTYLTPDEAKERGVPWKAREGEPQDLDDPFHYQTQDDSRRLGRDWATQQAIVSGNARHAGFTPEMSPEQIRRMGMTTPDELAMLSEAPEFPEWRALPQPSQQALPPGVPPGSRRLSDGTYLTPDGRIVRPTATNEADALVAYLQQRYR